MIFWSYKVEVVRDRPQDDRVEAVLSNETPQGTHTLVISYDPGAMVASYGGILSGQPALPAEICVEGYSFVEATKSTRYTKT